MISTDRWPAQIFFSYEKGRRARERERGQRELRPEKPISLALNINVCFVPIAFQEDPARAAVRLNDTDYLFRRPRETAD